VSTSPPDQAAPPDLDPDPDPTPPAQPPLYRIADRTLRAMTFTLPRPGPDEPDSAWYDEVEVALDTIAALNPSNPVEVILAIQLIAATAAERDAYRLAFEPGAPETQAHRHRANAAAMNRSVAAALRLLNRQRKQPVGPRRDWGDVVVDLGDAWRQAPARPAEAARSAGSAGTGKATAEDTPEVINKWFDEIDDVELAIATEQERRQQAGEPPLPRKPGAPIVIYSHKPRDYIHKFTPDPKNWQKYPGFENMTMAERREFFGYKYTGPNGPPEALTPASRDEMLAQMKIEEALDAEYYPRLSNSP